MTASPHTTNTLLFEASSYGVSLVFVLLWLRKHVTRPRRGVQSVLWALIQCFAFSCHVCSSRCLCWLHLSCRQAEVLCWIHGTNQSKVKEVTYSVLCVFAAIGLFHFFFSFCSTPGYLFGKRVISFLLLMCVVGISNFLLMRHYGSDYKEYVETITNAASALLLIP